MLLRYPAVPDSEHPPTHSLRWHLVCAESFDALASKHTLKGVAATYQVCLDKLARSQHIDPHPEKMDELLLGVVGGEVVLEHAFERIQPEEHGEE
jgi:hypothetical protein